MDILQFPKKELENTMDEGNIVAQTEIKMNYEDATMET